MKKNKLVRVNLCEEIRNDAAASYWLKAALDSALKRDPVDAVTDAEVLVMALRERCTGAFSKLPAFLFQAK
ncbi:hypothetical protein [Crenothrix polyspora]|uniref:Uncharacterized protein n=1 Tax=Crenothrix polyspora TaxID=360316 RepID=A0A1R4HI99_9GAMM|nr:hypothetical protein [Crenothrix polyspora]SJM95978.1 hypothetical protein CRENPOLYSF1_820012 [Crenothrix polyspora]